MEHIARTEENLEKSVEMENGLTLEIWNKSKVIAGDRWKIAVIAHVNIPVEKAFSNGKEELPVSIDQIREVLGDSVYFEKRIERFFIDETQKDELKNMLAESLFESVFPYLSREKFARRFILKEYARLKQRKSFFRQS